MVGKESERMACRAGYRVTAFGWMQPRPGQWERYLVRECFSCKRLHVDKLLWVNWNYVMCFYCFSQRVRVEDSQAIEIHCLDCGKHTTYDTTHELEDDAEDE
jgi:hypothetical protein